MTAQLAFERCPCGKELRHRGTHRKPRAPKACEQCGGDIPARVRPFALARQRYCSRPCYGLSMKGRKGTPWKRSRVTVECTACGVFAVSPPLPAAEREAYGKEFDRRHASCRRDAGVARKEA